MDPAGQEAVPPRRSSSHTTDHLANERTFLAWLRTALALIGLGFVLARMGLFLRQLAVMTAHQGEAETRSGREFTDTGIVVLALGTVLAIWTGWLYERNRRMIDAECYAPARFTVFIVAAVVTAGGVSIVGLVIWRILYHW